MDGPGAAWVSWEMLLFSQILKCCCLSCICIWGICIWGICIWGICICNWGLLGNVVHLAPQVVLLLCYCWCFFWSRSCRTPSTRSGIPTSDFPLLMYKLLPTVYKILQYRVLKSSTFGERKASFFIRCIMITGLPKAFDQLCISETAPVLAWLGFPITHRKSLDFFYSHG